MLECLGYAGAARLARPARSVGETLYLGECTENEPLQIPRADLSRHMMILGATGTGKSSLIRSLLAQDISAGLPVVLIDPHGDLYAEAVDLPDVLGVPNAAFSQKPKASASIGTTTSPSAVTASLIGARGSRP